MTRYALYGTILGDLAGQPYEYPPMKHFPEKCNIHNPESEITDDTLMTLAAALSVVHKIPIEFAMKQIGEKYFSDHFGEGFKEWLNSPKGTIGTSWGNGCLMRIAPYFYLPIPKEKRNLLIFDNVLTSHSNSRSVEAVNNLMRLYDQKELITTKGIVGKFNGFQVRSTETMDFVKKVHYNYTGYGTSLEKTLQKVISCGGDTDTNASIIGELHNFHHNSITEENARYVESKLDPFLLEILKDFNDEI